MVRNETHTISARVWEWEGKGSWYFVTIEKEGSKDLKNDWPWPRRGFGSIPVKAVVGSTSWKTSIFPEKGGTYLLPLKRKVREAEKIKIGNTIEIQITVIS